MALLSRADLAVGRLAGAARRLPIPTLLLRTSVRREAVLSSRIEGTLTTLGELLAAEADAVVRGGLRDLEEVRNCVDALEYGVRRIAELPFSLRLVKELHERLMRGVQGDVATPGEFRRSQNWIGPGGCLLRDAIYVPPPPDQLMACLGEWERFLHDESMPPLVHAALAHAQFEAIHPFIDGNGRVGRLLMPLLLVGSGVLPSPLLPMSAFLEATRLEYYARLLGVTARGEWEEWIAYFLRGVAVQADDALIRMERIESLIQGWSRALAPLSSRVPERCLWLFVESPFATVGAIAARLGVAFSTAQRAVGRLEAAGVVVRIGSGPRNRVYCAQAVLEVIEAPLLVGLTGGQVER